MDNSISIKPLVGEMPVVSEYLRKRLYGWKVAVEDVNKFQVVLDEILSNIISYSGADFIEFSCNMSEGVVVLCFIDNGTEFNPLEKKDTDLDIPLEEREFGGFGIFIVKNSVDRMEYEYRDYKNILTLYVNI